ncbi:MAG: hypothetical protein MPK31_00115, partial [Gammaproteobacteria bacterium]|nr:hypothetical protein [Gammaproteobacteria bacterium]
HGGCMRVIAKPPHASDSDTRSNRTSQFFRAALSRDSIANNETGCLPQSGAIRHPPAEYAGHCQTTSTPWVAMPGQTEHRNSFAPRFSRDK